MTASGAFRGQLKRKSIMHSVKKQKQKKTDDKE